MGFRQALQHTIEHREKEVALFKKQRGVMMRMLDSNTRLMGMGFNKLIEEAKARKEMLRNKLKFVIKALTDTDAAWVLTAYNSVKQRAKMLNGAGMGTAVMKKISLIKRLTNKGHNLQVMAVNCLKEFLASERD